MSVSLEDARYFHKQLDDMIRGQESGHDLHVGRRNFRAYLHCWKTVLYFVREAKGLRADAAWIGWVQRWQKQSLDGDSTASMEQLRETRDYDTHTGTLVLRPEIAIFAPLVFVEGVKAILLENWSRSRPRDSQSPSC
jgi:hypothetical protein